MIAFMKARRIEYIATDVVDTPWCDETADARSMPYNDASVGNIAGIDVIHHIPEPLKVFSEAERVLKPGGKLVLIEPYGSVFGQLVYRFLHHETFRISYNAVDPSPYNGQEGSFANGAIPTILFRRSYDTWKDRFPKLKLVKKKTITGLTYPLTGGFSYPGLVPPKLVRPLMQLEDGILRGAAGKLFALRILTVFTKEK